MVVVYLRLVLCTEIIAAPIAWQFPGCGPVESGTLKAVEPITRCGSLVHRLAHIRAYAYAWETMGVRACQFAGANMPCTGQKKNSNIAFMES